MNGIVQGGARWLAGILMVSGLSLVSGGAVSTAAAATPIPPSVQNAINTVQAKPMYRHTTFGMEVVDRDTGEVLLSQNPDKLFTTGSIMKTFTASALLARSGGDYRFHTPVYRRGKVRKKTLHGNLVMVASGDFTFGLRNEAGQTFGYNSTPQVDHSYADTGLPGPTILKGSDPLRAVNRLAVRVRKSGIRKVKGNVVVDDRLFKAFNGWPDGKMTPAWLNENLIDVQTRPTARGKMARIKLAPKTSMFKVKNKVRTSPAGTQSTLKLSPPKHGKLTISGKIPADSGPLLINEQVPNPSALMRTALIDALRRNGVKVKARSTGSNPRRLLPGKRVMKSGHRVAQYVSYPLSQLVKVVLKVSANRGADLLACMLAVDRGSRNCEDGLVSILENNDALGVPANTTYPFDGAGSDDMDRTSPSAAIALLNNVAGTPYGGEIYDALPILGVDGTFRETGLNSPAKGKIRAKSGNRVGFIDDDTGIAGAQTRIGYIDTAGGRHLVFADLLGNIPLTVPTQIFDIDADMTKVETAIQQGY